MIKAIANWDAHYSQMYASSLANSFQARRARPRKTCCSINLESDEAGLDRWVGGRRRYRRNMGWRAIFTGKSRLEDQSAIAPLPTGALRAIDQGRTAAKQELWLVAVEYFEQARRSAPLHPEPLYYLGLAEAQIPGRELRAICWLEAFIALAP